MDNINYLSQSPYSVFMRYIFTEVSMNMSKYLCNIHM